MTDIISENELVNELNKFKDVLFNYDYSSIDNVIFFDVSSLNHYIENYEDNPFEQQYKALEEILDNILPYLPNNLPDDTIEIITKILDVKYDDKEIVKQNIDFNIKLEFIQTAKNIKSDKEWDKIVHLCKKRRNSLEKMNDLTFV